MFSFMEKRLPTDGVWRGLGVQDLQIMGFALRQRWLWLNRTNTSRTWHGLLMQDEQAVQSMMHQPKRKLEMGI